MDVSKAVQKNIPILLARTSMSQATLATKSNVSKASIQRIMNGEVSPTLHTLQQLASGFGVPPATLIEAGLDRKSLTSVKKIDTAIFDIYSNLYDGPETIKTINKYFADDYKLIYGDQPLGSPNRVGCTLAEELESNKNLKSKKMVLLVKSAWLSADQVNVFVDIVDNHAGDPVAVGLNASAHIRTTAIIDSWCMLHSVREICDGAPVKIKTRTLKYIDTIMS
tara:strand:+ start:215 stop:883 length:669 start_codon:yes stop_codon:yes gene_type:complete